MQMMRLLSVWGAILAKLLVVGEAVHLRSTRRKGSEQFFQYDYSQHGQDWTSGSCVSREQQSPIDLPDQAPVGGQPFTYKYKPIAEAFNVFNNGHTFAADLSGHDLGGITYENEWYNLLNINVHSLSEHTWAGKRQPLELHLVHKHYAKDSLLIVAIAVESATPLPPAPKFLQLNASTAIPSPAPAPQPVPFSGFYSEPPSSGADFNPTLQAFLKVQPPAVNMKVSVPATAESAFELNSIVGSSMFYEYAGSLTAPPCAELATWLVRKDPIKASDAQVLYLHDAVYKSTADFGNYRAVMPLNGRSVLLRQGALEDPPKTPQTAVPMDGMPQQSDREFRAMKWGMDAMIIARSSAHYIKDLDQRIRNAAQAHADVLGARLPPLTAPATMTAGTSQGGPPMGRPMEDIPMEDLARSMAGALHVAAHEEVDAASKEISESAKGVAIAAARQAASIVATGQGDPMAMAYSVPGTAPLTPLRPGQYDQIA